MPRRTNPQDPPNLEVTNILTGDTREEAWALYLKAMTPLATMAVQRHVMTRGEFNEVALDPRVIKYTGYRSGRLAAVATYTNDLDAIPLISPPYFEHRWPKAYAEKRIWYIGFVAIVLGGPVFVLLMNHMHQTVIKNGGGISVFDACTYRSERLPGAVTAFLRHALAEQPTLTRIDQQSFYAYQTKGVQ